MIRKMQNFYLEVVVLGLCFFLGGCAGVDKKTQPLEESMVPKVESMDAETIEEQPPTKISQEDDKTATALLTDSGNSVTNKQIEKQLFSKPKDTEAKQSVTRIQRPVKGLNIHKTDYRDKKGKIIFNFDEASLAEVIRTFAQVLKIDYIQEADATGTVTVHTAGGLHKDEVFPVFFQILEANGLTAVKEEGIYRIVQVKNASKLPLNLHMRSDLSGVAPGERIIIQIISLEHIDVKEMVKIIQPFVSETGTIITHDNSDTMVLIDKGIAILKALNLVKVFDIDTFKQKNHHFYSVDNMDAEEAVKLIDDLLKAYGKSEIKTTLVPIKRLNAIIGVSSDPNILDWIDQMLQQLDIPGRDSSPKIYVYKVQNGSCTELGSILGGVFSKPEGDTDKNRDREYTDKSEDKQQLEIVLNRGALGTSAPKGLGSIKAVGLPESGSSGSQPKESKVQHFRSSSMVDSGAETLKGDIKITLDEARNALIIEAFPSDYQVIKKILKQLDIMPRQVLIEVTIADIELQDNSDLGIEWEKLVEGGTDTFGTIGSQGINFTIGLSDSWKSALKLLASEDRLNILSTPVVLASDNKKATIDVATDVPVVTTEYKSVDLSSDVVETVVQYRKTGIILAVTPHINDHGFVTMEVSQEVSNVSDGVIAGGQEYPSFRTRNVETTFTVNHQQTIMIGGLMTQTNSKQKEGVPYLSAIPGIGWIFGRHVDSLIKSELTIFITPHVIYSMGDVEKLTREFKQRLDDMDISKQDS